MGLPVWRYTANGLVIEKRVLMPHTQNTSIVRYRILEGDAHIRLQLRPSVHFRAHEDPVSAPLYQPYTIRIVGQHYELAGEPIYPALRLRVYGNDELPSFVIDSTTHAELLYRVEAGRGYASRGSLWSPGYFRADLRRDHDVALAASVEDWDVIEALDPASAWSAETERRSRLLALAVEPARAGVNAELVLAADQFLITPSGRQEDAARARAAGEELRTVIAGYHWFTDWGRDTMISLEGLTLCTGRSREAAYVLRTFAHYVKDGLIPNMFPDHAIEGLYHTADATLWYFHAIDRYFTYTSDVYTLEFLLPTLHDIVEHHLRGTRFGIGVDPNDGFAAPGRARLPAHLDGRQGRGLGGDAAPGQAGRDQRALVQTRCACSSRGRDSSALKRKPIASASTPIRRTNHSIGASGTMPAATCTTWWMANTVLIRPAVRISCSRFRCATQCSRKRAGSPCSMWCASACLHPMACAALLRGTRTTSRPTMATCAHAMPRTIRAPSGRG